MMATNQNAAKLFILCILMLLTACKTVNLTPTPDVTQLSPQDAAVVEREEEKQIKIEEIEAAIDIEKQVIYIEKPVYVPAQEQSKYNEENAQTAVINNIVAPEQYNGSAMIYDYQDSFVYEVYVKVLRMTDICLEPGEVIIGDPLLSDTVRFVWEIGVNQEPSGQNRQHIYIKPKDSGLESTLIINTNIRTYHIILKSYVNTYMPIIRWNYPLSPTAKIARLMQTNSGTSIGIKETFVSSDLPDFNFKMTYNVFKKPAWCPKLVYTFEGKTYVVLPETVLEQELPGIFGEKNDLINYRVSGNIFIIDKLLDTITLKYDGKKVTITRK